MEGPDFPIALGVIRDVDAPTYNDAVAEQIEEIKGKKKYHNFQELLMTNDTWEVKYDTYCIQPDIRQYTRHLLYPPVSGY